MVSLRALTVLMTGVTAAACSSASPQSPDVAVIDQRCADTASTGDSYRYCVQLGLEQAGLARPESDDGAAIEALLAK